MQRRSPRSRPLRQLTFTCVRPYIICARYIYYVGYTRELCFGTHTYLPATFDSGPGLVKLSGKPRWQNRGEASNFSTEAAMIRMLDGHQRGCIRTWKPFQAKFGRQGRSEQRGGIPPFSTFYGSPQVAATVVNDKYRARHNRQQIMRRKSKHL